MRKNPQIFWTILLLCIICILWAFFAFKKDNGKSVIDSLTQSNPSNEVLPIGEGQTVKDLAFGGKEYKHGLLGFGFSYLDEYTISSFGNFFDSVGETILLQNKDKVQGLQVHITPFDEDIDLTVKRIKKDLPTLSISEAKEIQIGSDKNKVQVVVFESNNNLSTGKSYEGWFVYRKNLYQISGSVDSKELFDKIIKTWIFEE